MAFPVSPSVGDIYSEDGRSWRWNGYAWREVAYTTLESLTADHGGLAGLGDDDHTQYLPVDGATRGATSISNSGTITQTSSGQAGSIKWTSGAGPHGLEMSPSDVLESALYYRTSPNSWSFEDSTGNKIAEFDADDLSTSLGGELSVAGAVTADHPYFDLRCTNTYSVPNTTFVAVPWNIRASDPANMHDQNNGYVTIPHSGIWMLNFCAVTDNSSTNYPRSIAIATDPTPASNTLERLANHQLTATGSGVEIPSCSWVGYLSANTKVYALCYQSSGGTATWNLSSRRDLATFNGAMLHKT